MDDLIRRSDVIKIIDDNVNGSDNRLCLKDLINGIPSAEEANTDRTERFIEKKLDEVRAELITMIGGDDE